MVRPQVVDRGEHIGFRCDEVGPRLRLEARGGRRFAGRRDFAPFGRPFPEPAVENGRSLIAEGPQHPPHAGGPGVIRAIVEHGPRPGADADLLVLEKENTRLVLVIHGDQRVIAWTYGKPGRLNIFSYLFQQVVFIVDRLLSFFPLTGETFKMCRGFLLIH